MKKLIFTCTLMCLSLNLMAQTVTNVVAKQVGDLVEITYDVDRSAEVVLYFSTDGGVSYDATPKTVSGDIGFVGPGHHRIAWHLLADKSEWDVPRARFKVLVRKKRDIRRFAVNNIDFDMILVEGGTFRMGATEEQNKKSEIDERPIHSVTLQDYYIGKTEVTQALWEAVMGSNPSSYKAANKPVELVSWNDCQVFIHRLDSILAPQLMGAHFTLPTEAQWEYAARGGKKSQMNLYCGSNTINSVAWFDGNSISTTHPVEGKDPNELGIYDMSGNVSEWCSDNYGSYKSSSQSNPTGATSGNGKVYRGGSWFNLAKYCRVSARKFAKTDVRFTDIGLRLVLIP